MEEKILKQWWITECYCVIGKCVTKVTVMNYVFSKPCKGNITSANITKSTQATHIILFLKSKKWAEGSLNVWLNCTMKYFSLAKNIFLFFLEKQLLHSYIVTLNPVISSFYIFPHMPTPNLRCFLSLAKLNTLLTVKQLSIWLNCFVEWTSTTHRSALLQVHCKCRITFLVYHKSTPEKNSSVPGVFRQLMNRVLCCCTLDTHYFGS